MRKGSTVNSFLLTILAGLLITGCSMQEQPVEINKTVLTNDVEKEWKVQYKELKLTQAKAYLNIAKAENALYAITNAEDDSGYKLTCTETEQLWQTTEEQSITELPIVIGENYNINTFFSDGEKMLYALGTELTENGTSHFLFSIDTMEKTLRQEDLTEKWQEFWGDNDFAPQGATDNEGNIYIADFWIKGKILIIQPDENDGIIIDLPDVELYDMTCEEGKVYFVGIKQGTETLFCMSEQSGQLEELCSLPESKGTMLFQGMGNGNILYACQDVLYQYDISKKNGTSVFTWYYAGIEGRNIAGLFAEGENVIVLPKIKENKDGITLLLLQNSPQNEKNAAITQDTNTTQTIEVADSEKQLVTICGDKIHDTELAKAVGRFNVLSEEYQIEITNYDYDKLLTEISSGAGPDLIPIGDIGITECVKKGLIEDLQPYLEKSEKLSREMLNEKILELFTINDVISCIPPSFYVSTLFGKESELGSDTGWTMEEFIEFVDSHRGLTVMEGSMRDDSFMVIMKLVWMARQKEWVDWEQGIAKFDEGEFEELLQFAAGYQAKYDGEDGSTEERWREGKVMLYSRPVTSIQNYLWYREILQGDMVAIGYPSQDGSPCNGIGIYGEYGINSQSENKEAAWAFIEYLVSSQTADESYQHGIPTLKSSMEDMLKESMEKKNRNIGGYDIPPATEKDIKEFRTLIDDACIYSDGSKVVEEILDQEMRACFYDGRSVEDTVMVIQNRVQLYLDEYAP